MTRFFSVPLRLRGEVKNNMPENIQLTHNEHVNPKLKYPLSLLVDNMNDPLNVGSLFRLSDALGISRIHLCGDTPAPPNPKINKTARSTEKYVAFGTHDDAITEVKRQKDQGACIIALELTSSSIDITSDDVKDFILKDSERSFCLLLGSENTGISEGLLKLADLTVHIGMCGSNSSMNVVSAASIACFEICRYLSPL
jgi:tRNA G18 (ribose-2'-O)-methylase SpoU